MVERPISPVELERLVERARAFAADLNDDTLRHSFLSSAFNLDRLAMKIVALADGESPATGSSHRLDELLLSKGGGESSSRANSGGTASPKSDGPRGLEGRDP